jgi:ParB/RepB/Spo0J family partition protein
MKTTPTAEKVQLLPLEKLHISEQNTRQPKPTEPSIKDLARSLKVEQTSPIVVRPHPKKKGHYEIAMGARRRVAAGVASLKMLKAIVREYDDDAFEEVILTDNLQREDPSPYAEALLLKRLIDRGTKTPKEIAATLGRTETWAVRRFRLATLDPALLKAWGKGDIQHFSAEMMDALAALPDEAQKTVAKDIHNWAWERLRSRKELEQHLAAITASLDGVKWLTDPRTFVKGCGPGCACDSSKKSELFDFSKGESCGRCLNPTCFLARRQKFLDIEFDRLDGGEKLRVVVKDEVTLKGTAYKQDYSLSWELKGKSSPGAEKVITYDKGKISYAWLPKKSTAKSSGGDAKTANPEERQKVKIDTLQGKRWLVVREKLFAALQTAKLTDLKAPLDSLIAIFGLPYREQSESWRVTDAGLWDYIFPGDGKFPTMKERSYHSYSSYQSHDDEDEEGMDDEDESSEATPAAPGSYNPNASFEHSEPDTTREDAIWPAVRHVLLGLIPVPKRIADVPKWEPHYRHLSKLIGFPIEIHKRKTDLEILPPKSWGKVDPHTFEPIEAAPTETKKKISSATSSAKSATGSTSKTATRAKNAAGRSSQ